MKLTNEQMQEEKSNLEQELRKLQVELVDILNLNDSLVAKNNEKVLLYILISYHRV
jgi:hypothetical protein